MTVTIGRRELLGFFCLNRCNEPRGLKRGP
jgi:hypothetical protein